MTIVYYIPERKWDIGWSRGNYNVKIIYFFLFYYQLTMQKMVRYRNKSAEISVKCMLVVRVILVHFTWHIWNRWHLIIYILPYSALSLIFGRTLKGFKLPMWIQLQRILQNKRSYYLLSFPMQEQEKKIVWTACSSLWCRTCPEFCMILHKTLPDLTNKWWRLWNFLCGVFSQYYI